MKKDQTTPDKNENRRNQSAPSADFPSRLIYVMEFRDISCKELAKKVFLAPSTISCYRNGTRDPSTSDLAHIAKALDVTTDYLTGLTDILINFSTIEEYLKKEYPKTNTRYTY